MNDSCSAETPNDATTSPRLLLDARELTAIEDCIALLRLLVSASKSYPSRLEGQAQLVFLRLELRLLFLASVYRPLSRSESERLSWLQSQALSLFQDQPRGGR